MGKPIEIKIVNRRPKDKPYGDLMMPLLGEGVTQARMQDPGSSVELRARPRAAAGHGPGNVPRLEGGSSPAGRPARSGRTTCSARARPMPRDRGPAARAAGPRGRGRRRGRPRGRRRSGRASPPGTFPSIPGLNMTDVGPDRNDPFPNRSFADIVTAVDEAPTGRFMLGVAASSFQGLFGNVTVYEKNFDIFNVPRSFNDVFNGKAFRGGGQEFRLDIQPGTQINRFQVSLREPYLFDLPIGAGVAGYWFNRFYPDWNERRGGGRFSLGRQFGTSIYADVAARIEDINFYGFQHPGSRRLPGGQRATRPCSRSGRASGSTTATPRSWPTRGSTSSSRSSRAGGPSPGPSSTPRAGPTSPPAAAPTAPASGSSPSAATSASPRRASRSTSGSSPVTSAASAGSSTAASARTPWACRSAAS